MKKINKIIVLCICAMFVFAPIVQAELGDTIIVSVSSDGTKGDQNSGNPSFSADGRYVAFWSASRNLVSGGGDANLKFNVFVHDLVSGETTKVSLDYEGNLANGNSGGAVISADGRYVAFNSFASDLITDDTNAFGDIFIRDRDTSVTTRVSVDSAGVEASGGHSLSPSISGDGRYVVFMSSATNLVSGDTNGTLDIFMHDRQTGSTTRISVDSSGGEANGDSSNPFISSDGRYVVFESNASNLVSGDNNGVSDIFVHDLQTGDTIRVSLDSSSIEGNGDSNYPTLSADGRFVAFRSYADNLVTGDTNGMDDVFVHDIQTGITTRVSVDSSGMEDARNPIYSSYQPSLSADGRYVAFGSSAANLVAGDTNATIDVFVHDRNTGFTTMVSVDSSGVQGASWSDNPSLSGDGAFVAFESQANNLVDGDNGENDVFVHELDFTAPEILFGDASVPASSGAVIASAPSTLIVQFSQEMVSDGGQHAANAAQNYMLVSPGANGSFDTASTSAAICDASHTPDGDDVNIGLSGIVYSSVDYSATLTIDASLTDGLYRLYVCGAQSIWNSRSIPLGSGTNSAIDFRVGAEPTDPLTTGHYEEDDADITLSGNWGSASSGEASGGAFAYSSDSSAKVAFSFIGSHAIIHRNVAPDRGDVEVWVDGSLYGTMNNYVPGHVGYAGYPIMGLVDGTHEVELVFSSGTYMDLDAIDVVDALGSGRYDNEGTDAIALDSWWKQATGDGYYNNTTAYTDADAARVTIPVNGTDVIVLQTMGPDKDNVDLYVDGAYHSMISNTFPGHIGYQSGTMVNGLSAGEHVIELRNASSGVYMDFDGIVILSPFTADTTVGDDHQNLAYRGEWLTYNTGSLHDGNMHWTSDTNACVKFTFEGTTAKLMRALGPDRGDASVTVDGSSYGTMVNYLGTGLGYQSGYLITGLSDSTHVAEMCFSGGTFMDLDAIVVYDPVSSGAGQLDDTDIRIAFNGSWDVANTSGPANSTMHYSSKEDATVWLRFNGAGVDITRFVGADRGDVDVYIDGEYLSTYSSYSESAAFQQVISITGLTAGDHTLELRNASPGTYMSIDAITVTD